MTAQVFPEGSWLLLTGSIGETGAIGIIGAPETTDPNLLRALAASKVSYYAGPDEAVEALARHDLLIDTAPVREDGVGARLDRLFAVLDENGAAIIYLDSEEAWPPVERLIGRYPAYSFRPSIDGKPLRGSDSAPNIHLLRCTRRQPYAYLFMDPSFSGKSNAAMLLSGSAGIPMASGDRMFLSIIAGTLQASQPFTECVRAWDNRRLFSDPALTDEFLSLIPQVSDRQPFILDHAVPVDLWPRLTEAIRARGYRTIVCSLAGLSNSAMLEATKASEQWHALRRRDALLRDILNSRSWRLTAPLRRLWERLQMIRDLSR
jgi:hypothetical protein